MHASNASKKDENEETDLEYIFVSGSGGSYTKSVRSHVLKRHVHAKRISKLPGLEAEGKRATAAPHGGRHGSNVERVAGASEGDSRDAKAHQLLLPTNDNPRIVRTSVSELERAMMQIKGPGSAARQNYLLSYCQLASLRAVGSTWLTGCLVSEGFAEHAAKINPKRSRFVPLRDIFMPNFLNDELGVHFACLFAVTHLAKVHNTSVDVQTSLYYNTKALQLLQERLSTSSCPSDLDTTFIAVVGLIALDAEVWRDVRLNPLRRTPFHQFLIMCANLLKAPHELKDRRVNTHIQGSSNTNSPDGRIERPEDSFGELACPWVSSQGSTSWHRSAPYRASCSFKSAGLISSPLVESHICSRHRTHRTQT
jgi:hypothetical protein